MKIKSILHTVTDASSAGLIGFAWTDTETGVCVRGKMGGGESNSRVIILRMYGQWTREVYEHTTELKTRKFEAWGKDEPYYGNTNEVADVIRAAIRKARETGL